MSDQPSRGVTLTQPRADLPIASEFEVMQRMSQMFQASGLYTNIQNVAQAIAIVQTGRELGIGPSMALREIYIIPGQGRPTLSAAILAALVQRDHGDDALRVVESTDEVCRVLYRRRSWDTPQQITFTISDAERALLVKPKSNWEKYPRAMLRSRAISEACRAGFSDSIMGLYSTEELAPEDVTVTPDGELVYDAAATPAPAAATPLPPEHERATIETVGDRAIDVVTGEIVDKAAPAQDPDEALRATVLASLVTSPDAVAKLPKPAEEMTAAELEKTLSWLRNRAKRAQATPQQVTPQQVTPQQASEPATQPAQEGPAPDPFSQARDLRADVAVRLANATPADLDQLAAETVTSVEGDAVSQAKAQEILDCVEFAERVLKAPSAGKLAQVEIDVAAARTAIKIGEDHRDALIALARRVRTQRGWATGEPALASAARVAPADADANVAEGLAPTDAELAAVAL